MSKATAHGVCTTLTGAGWLLRHPVDKTYTLGPALIAAGHAAGARQLDLVDHARPGDGGARRPPRRPGGGVEHGRRRDGAAGHGGPPRAHVAGLHGGPAGPARPAPGDGLPGLGGSRRRRGSGSTASGPSATDDDKERLRSALAVIRRRGYALNLEAVANLKLSRALSGRDSRRRAPGGGGGGLRPRGVPPPGARGGRHLPPQPDLGARSSASDGAVALALTVVGLPEKLTGEEIPRFGDALVDAAATGDGVDPRERPAHEPRRAGRLRPHRARGASSPARRRASGGPRPCSWGRRAPRCCAPTSTAPAPRRPRRSSKQAGVRAVARRVDVTVPGEVDALVVPTAVASSDGSTSWPTSPASSSRHRWSSFDDDAFDRIMAVNLTGVFRGCRAAARRHERPGLGRRS